jgi:hypothetical protein
MNVSLRTHSRLDLADFHVPSLPADRIAFGHQLTARIGQLDHVDLKLFIPVPGHSENRQDAGDAAGSGGVSLLNAHSSATGRDSRSL